MLNKTLKFIKKIINIIISIIKHIFLLITSLFVKNKIQSKKIEKTNIQKNEEIKNKQEINNNTSSVPIDPDKKSLPTSKNSTQTDNNNNATDKVKKIEEVKQKEQKIDKYYFIIMQAINEYFEKKYEVKIKKFSKEEKKNYNKFVEKLYPYVRKELIRYHSYDDDKLESIIETELEYVSKIEKDLKEKIYFLATPKPEEKITSKNAQQIKNEPIKKDEPKETSERIKKDTKEQSIIMVPTTETKEPTLKDEIPNIALATALTTANILNETFSQTVNKNEKNNITSIPEQTTEKEIQQSNTQQNNLKTSLEKETKTPIQEEAKNELQALEEKLLHEDEEIRNLEEKIKIKEVNEEKTEEKLEVTIEKQEQEEQKKEKEKEKEKTLKEETKKREEEFKKLGFYEEFELKKIDTNSKKAIDNSKEEMKKEDFEEKDYDGMINKIDNMLNEIEMTYIKYEGRLTEEQLASLKKEEEKLRNSKEAIQNQKNTDYENEHKSLEEPIIQSELDGLQNHLNSLEKENEAEVSESFLKKMDRLEGLTREQVATVDKRILMNRFRKASIALEVSSLLALPFIRNKFFLQFTAGLIVDNHFNFINGVFNRKLKKQDPVDLDNIKKGQDALNGALDITYKNMIELDYLEQKAITRYPELSNDARFINQTENLRNKLNKKYNKLMKKNELMEKHYGKTKKQTRILKFKRRKENEEAA